MKKLGIALMIIGVTSMICAFGCALVGNWYTSGYTIWESRLWLTRGLWLLLGFPLGLAGLFLWKRALKFECEAKIAVAKKVKP